MKSLFSCFLPAALALASTACGALSSGDDPEALATLEGRLTNAQAIEAPSALRVAVIWLSANERAGYTVAQDVEVEPVFPSNFRLALRDVPPTAAMIEQGASPQRPDGDDAESPGYNPDDPDNQGTGSSGPPDAHPGPAPQDIDIDIEPPPGVRVAVGTLVAYEDTNGNGKLDLVDIDASQFVDRVIGANPELMLLYVEGEPGNWGGEAGQQPRPGYQLLRLTRCESVGESTECANPDDPTCGKAQGPTTCNESVAILPVSALFELPISNDPELSSMMCSQEESPIHSAGGGAYPGQIPETDPGPAGYPPASEVSCDEGGRAYRVNTCIKTDHGPCRGISTSCDQRYVGLPSGAVPAAWPCTIEP